MYLFLLISILFSPSIIATILLTKNQWCSIRYILQSPETTPDLREKTNKIIYEKYEGWAYYQANTFKKTHPYLCRHLPRKEIEVFAMQGLHKAIQKYKPTYSFHPFLHIYVQGSLFKGVNQLQPMTTIPLYKRNHKKWSKYRNQEINRLRPILLAPEDYWKIEKNQQEPIEFRRTSEDYRATLNNLTISLRDKRIFTYKYPYNNDVRTNEDVAKLMCLSEETVRMSIKKTIIQLRETNNIMYK